MITNESFLAYCPECPWIAAAHDPWEADARANRHYEAKHGAPEPMPGQTDIYQALEEDA